MKLRELLIEYVEPNTKEGKVGHRRMITAVVNILAKKGKKVTRPEVSRYLKHMYKDTLFLNRIKSKSKSLGSDGYYWTSIRNRAASHFLKKTKLISS